MYKLKFLAAVFALLVTRTVYAEQKTDERRYHIDPKCFIYYAALDRKDSLDAIAKNLPKLSEGRIMLVEPIPYSGSGSITEGNAHWEAHSTGFMTYTKTKDGQVSKGRLGLIENVRDPGSRNIGSVVFDPETGGPVEAPDEVWIVRNEGRAHISLAESWRTSTAFFVDDLSDEGLAAASKRRDFIQSKIDSLKRDNCVLVYALPSNEDEVKAMGFSPSTISAWRENARRVSRLGLDSFGGGDTKSLLEYVSSKLSAGWNVLIWAHSPDGQSIAVPTVGEDGKREILPVTASMINRALNKAKSRHERAEPGMLIINGCRMPGLHGLGQSLALAGNPNLTTRGQFANANIDVLEAIAAGRKPEKPGQARTTSGSGTALSWLATFGGNLTVVLLEVILDDDDKKRKQKSVGLLDDGNLPTFHKTSLTQQSVSQVPLFLAVSHAPGAWMNWQNAGPRNERSSANE